MMWFLSAWWSPKYDIISWQQKNEIMCNNSVHKISSVISLWYCCCCLFMLRARLAVYKNHMWNELNKCVAALSASRVFAYEILDLSWRGPIVTVDRCAWIPCQPISVIRKTAAICVYAHIQVVKKRIRVHPTKFQYLGNF